MQKDFWSRKNLVTGIISLRVVTLLPWRPSWLTGKVREGGNWPRLSYTQIAWFSDIWKSAGPSIFVVKIGLAIHPEFWNIYFGGILQIIDTSLKIQWNKANDEKILLMTGYVQLSVTLCNGQWSKNTFLNYFGNISKPCQATVHPNVTVNESCQKGLRYLNRSWYIDSGRSNPWPESKNDFMLAVNKNGDGKRLFMGRWFDDEKLSASGVSLIPVLITIYNVLPKY